MTTVTHTALDDAFAQMNREQAELMNVQSRVHILQDNVSTLATVVMLDQSGTQSTQLLLGTAQQNLLSALAQQSDATHASERCEAKEAALRTEQSAIADQIADLQRQNDALRDQRTALGAERTALKAVLNPLQKELKDIKKQLNAIQDALRQKKQDPALIAERDATNTSIMATRGKIDVMKATKDILDQRDDVIHTSIAAKNDEIRGLKSRLRVLGKEITVTHGQWAALQTQLAAASANVAALRTEVQKERDALDAAMAQEIRDGGLLDRTRHDLLLAGEQMQKEAADVEAAQTVIADLLQKTMPQAPALPAAAVRESTVAARSSVAVTRNGDWLELRTRHFNGDQVFRLGDTVITPSKGNSVMTIPHWAAPEAIRWNLEAIQSEIDRQMVWNQVTAPAAASRDVFKTSSLGRWTVEIGAPDGTTTRVSPDQLISDIGGIPGLTGSAPEGRTGRELVGASPRIVSRPMGEEVSIQIENMPAGYTLQIERGKPWEYHQTIFKKVITPGSFAVAVDNQGRFLHWTILGPTGEFVDDRVFDPYREVAWPLPMIPSPFPPGTKDLPLAVAMNTTDGPLAIASLSDGTDPLPAGSLLVRPTAGRDVRLAFAPNGAGRVMLHGQLNDLDRRGGDGITVTLAVRKADGTLRELWSRSAANGAPLLLGLLPQELVNFDLAAGESVVLTVSSGSGQAVDDRCDAVHVDVDVALLPEFSASTSDKYPMGSVAAGLKSHVGSDIIDRVELFPAGQLNLASSSDDIARAMMGTAYDGLSDTGKSSMRSGIETAQAAAWTMMVGVVQQEFDWVLLKMNGVAMPPSDAPYNDGHQGTYLAQIPNLPSRAHIRNVLWEHREELYTSVYVRCIADSGSVLTNAKLEAQRNEQREAKLFDTLRTAGLITANNMAPLQRLLDQQLALDRIYIDHTGTPDRSGWMVADFQNFDTKVAERSTLVAGLKTDTTTEGGLFRQLVTAKSPLDLKTLDARRDSNEYISLSPGEKTSISFHVDSPFYLNASIESLQGGLSMALQKDGMELWHSHRKAGDGISMSGPLLETGDYEIELRCDETEMLIKQSQMDMGIITKDPYSYVLNLSLAPQSKSKIVGKISREGRPEVFDVSMSVVAFDEYGNKVSKDPSTGKDIVIDPNKNTWIVIHGRTDEETSTKIQDLARSLPSGSNDQVITIDWSGAAADNFIGVGLDGANWITKVGDWVANQLKALGITDGHQIRIAGHSWGSFVAFEIATHFGKVQVIVALDSASDSALMNDYAASRVNFAAVSENSWAFHSSVFGSYTRALTARFAIDMQDYSSLPLPLTVGGLGKEALEAYYFKHAGAVYLFSDLLKSNANGSATRLQKRFALDSLLTGKGPNGTEETGSYDGTLWVQYEERTIFGEKVLVPVIADHNFSVDPVESGSSSDSSSSPSH